MCTPTCTAMDYSISGLPVRVNLTQMDNEECYNVTILDDTLIESTKSFFMEFSITGGSDITVMADNQTEVVILDNDGK